MYLAKGIIVTLLCEGRKQDTGRWKVQQLKWTGRKNTKRNSVKKIVQVGKRMLRYLPR